MTMEKRCAACGYVSANAAFFHEEADGAFGRRSAFCIGCMPQVSLVEKASAMQVRFALTLLPLGLIVLFVFPPGMLPIALGLSVAGAMSAMRAPTILIHEFGHWAAARLVGYKVISVTIGGGPLLAS